MRCEGWRRNGGAFTFGPVKWSQCENNATVILEVVQEEVEQLPACMVCWQEAIEKGIKINHAKPIQPVKDKPKKKSKRKVK